MKHIEIKNIW